MGPNICEIVNISENDPATPMDSILFLIKHVYITLIDKSVKVNKAYIDFSKAFDKVPHKRLVKNVMTLGVQLLQARIGNLEMD